MPKIKLIIFDLDGTLINAYKAVEMSVNFTMRSLGLPLKGKDLIRRSVGWGDRNLLERFVPAAEVEKAINIYRRHHAMALKSGTRFLPGTKLLLKNLSRAKYHLAVASNRPTRFSLIAVHHLGIKKYFDYILCADKLKHGKPHPEILHQITRRLNILPFETLFVGDMTIDVETGHNAGIKTVAVLTGSSSYKELRVLKPYRIIKTIKELPTVIKVLNEQENKNGKKKKTR